MSVLLTCKFDEDPIKSKGATLLTTFSPLNVYGGKIVRQGRVTSNQIVQSDQTSNSSES